MMLWAEFQSDLLNDCRKMLERIDLPSDAKDKKEVTDLPDPVDFSKLTFPHLQQFWPT